MRRIRLILALSLVLVALLTACGGQNTTETESAPEAPTVPLTKVEVRDEGAVITIQEENKTFEFKYLKSENDVEITRSVTYNTGVVEVQESNDFSVCGIDMFIVGPLGAKASGQEYFHTCQKYLFGNLQAKVYDDRLEVLYETGAYTEVK